MSQTIGLCQGSLEERFAHILQPIRDLAKNWDIDIANYLEEYLDDLEKIEITFDDGATTMNFSEAALLIQGSAGVYAKKVEYLYALVFQVLDLVTQNKRQKTKQGENGANPETEETNPTFDAEFLPLDGDVCGLDCMYVKEQDTSTNKSVRPVPEMPTRLIPLEEAEKGDNSIYNKKGEVLGNHCDFNIDMGYICSNGSVLLEMADLALVDYHVLVCEDGSRTRYESLGGNFMEDDDGLDPDFVENNLADEHMNVNQAEEVEDPPSENNDANCVQMRPQSKKCAKKVTFGEAPTAAEKKKKDPFALLDPYEKSKSVEKPFQKKKTSKIPEGLVESTSKKRKKKKTKSKKELAPLYEVVEKVFSNASKFPKSKLKVPEFPEFEDAFWEEYKLRDKVKAEEIKELKKQRQEEADENEEDNEEEGEKTAGENALNLDVCMYDDINNFPPLELAEDLFRNDSNVLKVRAASTETGYATLSQDDVSVTYEDLVQMHVEKFLASASEYAQITDLSRRVSEWEEKITPKLEEEQTHPSFDIHKYGSVLIEKMVRGEMTAFRKLVKGFPLYEVCRYALATLQLANAYNLELTVKPDPSGNIMDCLYVTLISTKRHYEDLQEYQAPSLKDI